MKVGKFLTALVFSLIFMVQNCFAMKFSQPVEIGSLFASPNGVVVKNADYISGKQFKTFENEKTYTKFIARWGNETNGIYCNFDKYPPKFGGKDISNSFPIPMSIFCNIYQIKNDGNISLYMLKTEGSSVGMTDYILVGKQKNGKWVRFFDMEDITKQYFGVGISMRVSPDYNRFSCKGDTITIIYRGWEKKYSADSGEFRFKWDEAAQWFSVEQIKY